MGLGLGEIIIILVIAYVVVGPEDMVKLAGTIARALRRLRKMGTDVEEEIGLPGTIDLRAVTEQTVKDRIKKDAAGSVGADLDSVLREIQKAEEKLTL